MGGSGWQGEVHENELSCSFSGVVVGGGSQGEVNLPKTSAKARFRGVVGGGRLKKLLD